MSPKDENISDRRPISRQIGSQSLLLTLPYPHTCMELKAFVGIRSTCYANLRSRIVHGSSNPLGIMRRTLGQRADDLFVSQIAGMCRDNGRQWVE